MTELQKKALKELLTEALGDVGRITLKDAVAKMRGVRGFFTEEGYARAQQAYEERLTASVIREVESDGVPVYCSVSSTDEQGNVTHEYVQIPLLDIEQFKQATEYRVKMALRHIKVLKVLATEYKAQHHGRLPLQLSLIEEELDALKPFLKAERPKANRAERVRRERKPTHPTMKA